MIVILLFAQPVFAQVQSQRSDIIENYKGQSYYMHFVREGETVQSIAKLYGVTNVELLEANPEMAAGLRPDHVIRVPVKAEKRREGIEAQDAVVQQPGLFHEVLPRETWYGIARMYKIPVKDLINANAQVDTLKIGMKIRIPEVSGKSQVITGNYAEHTVKPQETLYSLSKRYSTTTDELLRLNPFLSDGLKVGQILMVPISAVGGDAELKIQVTDTSYFQHKVEKKETLYSISKMYGVDQTVILKANPQINGSLKKGDILIIPKEFKEVKAYTRSDTVILGRKIDQAANESIRKEPCSEIRKNNNEYNVALLVPLQLELVDSIRVTDPSGLKSANEYSAFDFIQFYEGTVIAADSMARKGMNVKLHVFDADFGSDTYKTRKVLSRPEMAGMDLIIGPFFSESFALVSNFAREHKIPVINPLSRRTEITKGNEYIVKMQPSGWAQYNSLGKYLVSAHHNDNIVLVRRNEDENSGMAQVIKSALLADSTNPVHFKEVIYSSKGWNGIVKSLSTTAPNIVVIMTADKAVLPALLRDLSAKADGQNISVVGLAEWEEMELDYNYLIKLNAHFFKPWFVDYQSPAAKNFIKEYRDRYAGEPEVEKYAYLGYDATLFFLQSIYKYGNGFLNCIESQSYNGLSSDFQFIKTSNGGFENFGTSVFKYTEFKREKLN